MAVKYKELIVGYCSRNGIRIPPGFGRNSPNRYAIVRATLTPPKLIATTWFKVGDVVFYIEHFLAPELGERLSASIRILDFKDQVELKYNGTKRLAKFNDFATQAESRGNGQPR